MNKDRIIIDFFIYIIYTFNNKKELDAGIKVLHIKLKNIGDEMNIHDEFVNDLDKNVISTTETVIHGTDTMKRMDKKLSSGVVICIIILLLVLVIIIYLITAFAFIRI